MTSKYFLNKRWISFAIIVLVCIGIWHTPGPEGVSEKAWHMLAIFIATIIGLVVRPFPMGAVAMLGITTTAITGILPIEDALSGFGNRVIWLIVIAFFISRGFIKTGLGTRIAWLFIAKMGHKSLGLAYGMVATDLVLSPAIPSNTARSGGVIFPLIRSVARAYDSDPEKGTAREIGAFLIFSSFQGTVITSAMFLTAMAANPLAAQLAGDLGVEISWGAWALAAIVPGLISLFFIPWLIFKTYPPKIKHTPAAAEMARTEMAKMGKMKREEKMMLSTFFLLLTLWILGRTLHLHSSTSWVGSFAAQWGVNLERYSRRKGSVEYTGLVCRSSHDGDSSEQVRVYPLVYPDHGRPCQRCRMGYGFFGPLFGVFLQPLSVRQQHGSCEFDVHAVPGGGLGRGNSSHASRSGAGFFQQPVQQYDSLRNRPRSCPVRLRLRGYGFLVEARFHGQYREYYYLDWGRRSLVETPAPVVIRATCGLIDL